MERDLLRDALSETRARIAAMEALLDELPAIFEAKFRQRLQPLLEQQQQLLDDNAELRQQLLMLQASETPRRRPRLLPWPGGRRLSGDDGGQPRDGSANPTRK